MLGRKNDRLRKHSIIRNFSRAAHSYDQNALVQKVAAKKLMDFFKDSMDAPRVKSVLEVGCGTGYVTEHLFDSYQSASYLVTDISKEMLQVCKSKMEQRYSSASLSILPTSVCSFPPRDVQYCVGDAENTRFGSMSFDLVISGLTLQWVDSLATAVHNLMEHGHTLIFSTLLNRTFIEWKEIHKKYGLQHGTPDYPCAEDIKLICGNIPYTTCHFKMEEERQFFQSPLEFIRNLNNIGANLPRDGYKSLNLRPLLREFPNGINATYEIMYCIIQKNR